MSLARPSYQLRPKSSLMVWLLRFVVLSVIGATMLALLLLMLLSRLAGCFAGQGRTWS